MSNTVSSIGVLSTDFFRPRSGFSFLPTPEGIILHGGYVKEYVKGKRVEGKALDDTWFLQYVQPLSTSEALFISLNGQNERGESSTTKMGGKPPPLHVKRTAS